MNPFKRWADKGKSASEITIQEVEAAVDRLDQVRDELRQYVDQELPRRNGKGEPDARRAD